jgi:hypothetical protein
MKKDSGTQKKNHKKLSSIDTSTERNKEEPLTICSEYKENVITWVKSELA